MVILNQAPATLTRGSSHTLTNSMSEFHVPGVRIQPGDGQPTSSTDQSLSSSILQRESTIGFPYYETPLYDPQVFNIQFGPQIPTGPLPQTSVSSTTETPLPVPHSGDQSHRASRDTQNISTEFSPFDLFPPLFEPLPRLNSTVATGPATLQSPASSTPYTGPTQDNDRTHLSPNDRNSNESQPSYLPRIESGTLEIPRVQPAIRRRRFPVFVPLEASQVDTLASVGYHATLRAFGSISVFFQVL